MGKRGRAQRLHRRQNTPLVVAKRPQRANTYLALLTFEYSYGPNHWDKVLNRPGKRARLWAGQIGVGQLSILDAFGAKKLWITSGAEAGGLVYFANIIGENRGDSLKEDIGMVWHEHESFEDYHSRVFEEAKLGVVLWA